jgi:hypothetical protein
LPVFRELLWGERVVRLCVKDEKGEESGSIRDTPSVVSTIPGVMDRKRMPCAPYTALYFPIRRFKAALLVA